MKKKQKSFEQQMMDIGRIPNLTAAGISALYMFYFSGLPLNTLTLAQKAELIGIVLTFVVVAQFIIAPKTNNLITKKLNHLSFHLSN